MRLGTAYLEVKADTGKLKSGLHDAETMTKSASDRMAKSFKAIGVAATAAFAVGVYQAQKMAKESIALAVEQEAVEKRLAAVIKSTGQAAGFSAAEMFKMAGAMQDITTTGDEVIISGMAILSTFKNISGEAFKRTTMSALDLSEVMGQDLRSSVVMLGKALNDPIANLGALGRAGIQFEKEQKDLIKTLWGVGDQAAAQAIILKELESQFGGTAKAARDQFGGADQAMSNAYGDMKEKIGGIITQNEALTGVYKELEKTFKDWGKSIAEFGKSTEVQQWLASVGESIKAFIKTGLPEYLTKIKNGFVLLYDVAGKVSDAVVAMWDILSVIPNTVIDSLNRTEKEILDIESAAKKSGDAIKEYIKPPEMSDWDHLVVYLTQVGDDLIEVFAFMYKSIIRIFANIFKNLAADIKVLGKMWVDLGNIIWDALTFDFEGLKASWNDLLKDTKDFTVDVGAAWKALMTGIQDDWKDMLHNIANNQDPIIFPAVLDFSRPIGLNDLPPPPEETNTATGNSHEDWRLRNLMNQQNMRDVALPKGQDIYWKTMTERIQNNFSDTFFDMMNDAGGSWEKLMNRLGDSFERTFAESLSKEFTKNLVAPLLITFEKGFASLMSGIGIGGVGTEIIGAAAIAYTVSKAIAGTARDSGYIQTDFEEQAATYFPPSLLMSAPYYLGRSIYDNIWGGKSPGTHWSGGAYQFGDTAPFSDVDRRWSSDGWKPGYTEDTSAIFNQAAVDAQDSFVEWLQGMTDQSLSEINKALENVQYMMPEMLIRWDQDAAKNIQTGIESIQREIWKAALPTAIDSIQASSDIRSMVNPSVFARGDYLKADISGANTLDELEKIIPEVENFAKAISDLSDAWTGINDRISVMLGTQTEYERQLSNINSEFDEWVSSMEALGFTERAIAQIEANRIPVLEKLNEQFAEIRGDTFDDMERYISRFNDSAGTIQSSINNADKSFREFIETLTDAGASIEDIAAAEEMRIEAMVAAAKQPFRNLIDDIQTWTMNVTRQEWGVDEWSAEFSNLSASIGSLDETSETYFDDSLDLMAQQFNALQNIVAAAEQQISVTQQAIDSIDSVLWDLKGGSMAPVQSIEGMQQHYDDLFAAAQTGDAVAAQEFTSFAAGDYRNFMAASGMNYKDLTDGIINDLEATRGYLVHEIDLLQSIVNNTAATVISSDGTTSAINGLITALQNLELAIETQVTLDAQMPEPTPAPEPAAGSTGKPGFDIPLWNVAVAISGAIGTGLSGFAGGGRTNSLALAGEIGPEWITPTYEPQRGNFLRETGIADMLEKIVARNASADGENREPIHIHLHLGKQELGDAMVDLGRSHSQYVESIRNIK